MKFERAMEVVLSIVIYVPFHCSAGCQFECESVTEYGDVFTLRAGSSVGIVTELRAGRSGIESRWGRDFPPVQTGPGAYPAPCKMGTGSFPGVK